MTGPSHAVVSLPALDLRPAPDHRAELASQLLLGETVRMLSRTPRRGWYRVRSEADGYEGWARGWGLVPVTQARARRWRELASGRVCVPFVTLTSRAKGGVAVGPLFFASRVIAGRNSRGLLPIELPDGRRGWAPAEAVHCGGPCPTLWGRVTSLLGTPYLWGGRTPAGMDCSAFTQLVLAEQGVELPRDAREQHARARVVRDAAGGRIGDLACFARPGEPVSHVGLALGNEYFAHSRGAVRIASMNPDNPMWDKELCPQFVGWFRPRAGGGRPRGWAPRHRLPA